MRGSFLILFSLLTISLARADKIENEKSQWDDEENCIPYSCYTFIACSDGKTPNDVYSEDACRDLGGNSWCDGSGFCHPIPMQ